MGVQVIQEGYCLYSFAQSHLIGQNRVPALVPVLDQPVETLELKFFKSPIVFEYGVVFLLVLRRLFVLLFELSHVEVIEAGLHSLNIGGLLLFGVACKGE